MLSQLFVQANESRCGLHVDQGSTHFWQHVASGRKVWRLFAPSAWPRLFSAVAWERAFFRDPRCAGLFGAAAEAAAGCEDAYGGAAVDAFDDAALEQLASGAELEVFEATLGAGDTLFVPANSPHQVLNRDDAEGRPATAVSMNFVDASNLEEARRASLQNPDVHPRFRPRLRKGGVPVPGSQARWYERFRMPMPKPEDSRLHAASLLDAIQRRDEGARAAGAFLEPWRVLSQRAWNLNVTLDGLAQHFGYSAAEQAQLLREHQASTRALAEVV